MNAFLRGHKIVSVEKHFVANEADSYWSFCIKYIIGKPKDIACQKKMKAGFWSEQQYQEHILPLLNFVQTANTKALRKNYIFTPT